MAKAEDLSTDWQQSAGDFSCTVCHRKRLPASEFSKKQVEKLLDSLKTLPEKDIRDGPDIQRTTYLSGVCKSCMEQREEQERAEAKARREERDQGKTEAPIEPPERVTVSFAERPFGMTPSKADGVGYLVAKTSEGKPAMKAGVRPGWRLVEVANTPCRDFDLEAAQALLKGAELPIALIFEAVPGGADFCTACQQVLAVSSFSRKMRTKPAEKRRCSACIEAVEGSNEVETAEGGAAVKETEGSQPLGKSSSKLSELQALCAETAREAEQVTGIKAARGGRGGRGRGRH